MPVLCTGTEYRQRPVENSEPSYSGEGQLRKKMSGSQTKPNQTKPNQTISFGLVWFGLVWFGLVRWGRSGQFKPSGLDRLKCSTVSLFRFKPSGLDRPLRPDREF